MRLLEWCLTIPISSIDRRSTSQQNRHVQFEGQAMPDLLPEVSHDKESLWPWISAIILRDLVS
jgi:hypothetical protein